MKFQSLSQLRSNLEGKEVFHNEIKGKRLRKQLQALQDFECEDFRFKCFEVSDIAIFLHIVVEIQGKQIELAIRMDFEYPFSPPQIFYTGQQYSHLAYCKDLLTIILKDQMWGPSFTLTYFLQKISLVAKAIIKKYEIPPIYHRQFQYSRQELLSSGIQLIEVEEYQWRYWVKMTKKKVIGLSNDCFLVFDKLSEVVYRLTYWSPVAQFTEVKADRGKSKFQLTLTLIEEQKPVKIYYGGQSSALNQILQVLNPIEMTQRKIENMEKSGIQDYEQAIRLYTILIEYYSTREPELMNKYVKSMKKVIEQQYDTKETIKKQQKMVEIQT